MIKYLGIFLFIAACMLIEPVAAQESCDNPSNSIVEENCLPGVDASVWRLFDGEGQDSDGDIDQIQGFATSMSVNLGDSIVFKVNNISQQVYGINIYRVGYYGGKGARFITSLPLSTYQPQPACNNDNDVVDCGNWGNSRAWNVPTDAVSGVYIAQLSTIPTGTLPSYRSNIYFVVRDDSAENKVVYQTADSTWQAYNLYGDMSLYNDCRENSNSAGRAVKVSYNRPFKRTSVGSYCDKNDLDPFRGLVDARGNFLFYDEIQIIRFLEGNGYDVTYASSVDVKYNRPDLTQQKIFISGGHDEYWSREQRVSVTSARDAGVALMFLGGNDMFWKTRYDNDDRSLITYKESKISYFGSATEKLANPSDPTNTWTGLWRDVSLNSIDDNLDPLVNGHDGGPPENELTGTLFTAIDGGSEVSVDIPASFRGHRFWRNTMVETLEDGAVYSLPEDSLGGEWNTDFDNGSRPPGLFHLSATNIAEVPSNIISCAADLPVAFYRPDNSVHHLTMYRHSAGNLVFSAGTLGWGTALEGTGEKKKVMQQAMVNLFADMDVQPGNIKNVLSLATKSTDTSPPTAVATTTFPNNISLRGVATINGTALDFGGGVVAGVEVSTDGGSSFHPASGAENWSYQFLVPENNSFDVVVRAVDDSGNISVSSPQTFTALQRFDFVMGELELKNAVVQENGTLNPEDWDEFTGQAATEVYTLGFSDESDIRPWIGFSGFAAEQQLRFKDLTPGREYNFKVFPSVVVIGDTNAEYSAVVRGTDTGVVTSSARKYLPRGSSAGIYGGTSADAWSISFVPDGTEILLGLTVLSTGTTTDYMYIDAISSLHLLGEIEGLGVPLGARYDEFTSPEGDEDTYIFGDGNAKNIRQWIGYSDCGPGCPKHARQRLQFENLEVGRQYSLNVYPAYIATTKTEKGFILGEISNGTLGHAVYQAAIVKGAACINSPYKQYSVTGEVDSFDDENVWKILFTPYTPFVTLELGNDRTQLFRPPPLSPNSSNDPAFMYIDAIEWLGEVE